LTRYRFGFMVIGIRGRTKEDPDMRRFLVTIPVALLIASLAWAGEKTVDLKVSGMSCGSCSDAVTKSLSEVKGVKSCNVDLKSGKATITADESVPNDELVKAVSKAGKSFSAEVTQ
jgi:copper chaperone CopZ